MTAGDFPDVGYASPIPPRIPTRVIPKSGWSRLSFASLGDIVQATQHILLSVAHEILHGVELAFSDLRRIDAQVTQFARLYAEPFEEGSFIIPAELGDEPVTIEGKEIHPQKIVDRFVAVMEGVAIEGPQFKTNLAVLQSIEELDKALKRDVEFIEFMPSVSAGLPNKSSRIIVNSAFVLDVTNARKSRVKRRLEFGTLDGIVRAVDTIDRKIRLELSDTTIVTGRYPLALQERVTQALGRKVQLSGDIIYMKEVARHLDLTHVELPSSDHPVSPSEPPTAHDSLE